MKTCWIAALALAAVNAGIELLQPGIGRRQSIRIVLVGDSTVTDDKGWGAGLCALFDARVECVNKSAGGRSSKSYMDEGRWDDALALKAQYYLVQFGHNDEPGKGPERETDPATTYREYMSRYIDDARAIGATPVLVTSLTRRKYDDAARIVPNIVPYVAAVKGLAGERRVAVIDLHARSVEAAERTGATRWALFSPRDEKGQVDTTHLNAAGGAFVGAMVAEELRRLVPALRRYLRPAMLPLEASADAIVAADGTGQYASVQEAINAAPQNTSSSNRWVILVKPGLYREVVYVQREKRFVSLVGWDAATATISYDLHAKMTGLDGKAIGTFRTPTVTIDADDFSVENLTVENSAGPVGQALALRVDGDRVVFRNCRFLGWQDTVFLNRGRQYLEDVFITGHVDFVFGGATAWFERVRLHARRDGYITAASTPAAQQYGFVFAHGQITGEPGVRTYLGRPWRDHAQTAFVDTEMSEVVDPRGWNNWDRPEREKTARYAEGGNTGAGAASAARVPWAKRLTAAATANLSPVSVLGGEDRWKPQDVPSHPSGSRAITLPVPSASRDGWHSLPLAQR